jgi:1,4-alpha-glucan branching enzyme
MPAPRAIAPTDKPGMGAVPTDGGCVFRVWAPFAERVTVGGDFFHAGNLEPVEWHEVPLARDAADGDGAHYWSAFVEGARPDSLYKLKVKNDGLEPGSGGAERWKHDPYARDAVSFAGNSVVVDRDFDWSGDDFRMPGWNELVVYELHIGTFNHEAGKPPGTFEEAIGKLDYLASRLGVNAVEVMPAFDFETTTSMGYNTALPFAIDNAYGRTASLKDFVKAAHRRGIAVIMDVVYNHWGPEGLADGLGQFDGFFLPDKQGIYFYEDERSATPYGRDNRPDYGRAEVRRYIRDNAMTLLDEFRLDGLRLDDTIDMRRPSGRDLPDGFTLLRWLGEEKRRASPWKILIAEDLQNDDAVTRDALLGGMGMDAQWDPVFKDRVRGMLLAPSDDARRASAIAEAVAKSYNASGPFARVVYAESHDEAKFRRITDEVAPGDAEGWLARKLSALGAALVMTSPGIPMIFMGQEFLEFRPWSDGKDFALDFTRIGRHPGFVDLYARLVKLRRNFDDNTRGLRGGNTNVFFASDADGVLAYHRWDRGGPGDDVVVVVNLRNQVYPSYGVGFPRPGTWYLRFNSDWRGFAPDFGDVGYDTTAAPGGDQGMPCSGDVGLGPYAVCIYSQ